MEKEPEDLQKLVKSLVRYEHKLTSLSWNFWRGIVYGLGFFIGSAMIAAILIYILSRVFHNSNLPSEIRDIIDIYKNIKQ